MPKWSRLLCLLATLPAAADADVVHRWSFDDARCRDVIGGANARLLEGARVENGAVRLDGKRAHVELPVGFTISTLMNCTFEGWLTWDGGPPWQRFFDFGESMKDPADGREKGRRWFMITPSAGSGHLEMHINVDRRVAGRADVLGSGAALPSGRPTHVAIALEGNRGRLFVDGRRVAEGPVAMDPGELGRPKSCWLGRSNWPADPCLRGAVSEFRIHDRSLSDEQVLASFNAGADELPTVLDETPRGEWQPAPGGMPTRWTSKVDPAATLPEYPRPQLRRREWQNLNGLWDLKIIDPSHTGEDRRDIRERILVPFPIESPLSGVMKRATSLRYLRTFQIPPTWGGHRVLLHFGAVDHRARVILNGKLVGEHVGGYDPFSFDITDQLVVGRSQVLVVEVDDPSDAGDQPRGKQVLASGGIWYTPVTGIWQTVWIEPVPQVYVSDISIVPDVDTGSVDVTVSTDGDDSGCSVEVVALRNDGLRRQEIGRVVGAAGRRLSLPLRDAALWSPRSPTLHDLEIRLRRGGENVDRVGSYFGMRKIEARRDRSGVPRLFLNGEPLFQMGPLDQGYWPDGIYTAPTDEALRHDIDLTRRLGFNMTRKHVKVEPSRWYHWCDRRGLLVWQDMPSANNKTPASREQFELELRRLVATHRNHPSIVAWVVFNEGWGQHDDATRTELVRSLDPTRLVVTASGWHDRGQGDVVDVHCYPGPGWNEPDGDRVAVIGEYGGPSFLVKGHTWATGGAWGYSETKTADELTRTYVDLARGIRRQEASPGVAAAVFTQLTDVEREINGLVTFDREVIKVDTRAVGQANRGVFDGLGRYRILTPTALRTKVEWRFTTDDPGEAWTDAAFDDGDWRRGAAGFGRAGARQGIVRTTWNTGSIWLRRELTLDEAVVKGLQSPRLLLHHDDDAEVWINGVPAARREGPRLYHEEIELLPEARAALRPGRNVIAVLGRGRGREQYIDVGLVDVEREPDD